MSVGLSAVLPNPTSISKGLTAKKSEQRNSVKISKQPFFSSLLGFYGHY